MINQTVLGYDTFTVKPLSLGNVMIGPPFNGGQLQPYAGIGQILNACSVNTHYWACDHAEKCKCGKVARVIEAPKCGTCGAKL